MKNLAGMLKQASQMQQKMEEMQATLAGMEVEGEGGLVFEGFLSYRFLNGSRLNALARLQGNGEVGAASLSMEMLQTFRCGTGKLAGVAGGTGTGTATLWESAYEIQYVTAGYVLFAAPR